MAQEQKAFREGPQDTGQGDLVPGPGPEAQEHDLVQELRNLWCVICQLIEKSPNSAEREASWSEETGLQDGDTG